MRGSQYIYISGTNSRKLFVRRDFCVNNVNVMLHDFNGIYAVSKKYVIHAFATCSIKLLPLENYSRSLYVQK